MKNNLVKIFISLTFIIFYSCFSIHDKVKYQKFIQLVGNYQLDIERTNLHKYVIDSINYKDLNLLLSSDGTFKMNKSVPFIYDSCGTWRTGGNYIDDMNIMIYNRNRQIDCQFTILYKNGNDSIFEMNSVTPREKQYPIHEIFFKKILLK